MPKFFNFNPLYFTRFRAHRPCLAYVDKVEFIKCSSLIHIQHPHITASGCEKVCGNVGVRVVDAVVRIGSLVFQNAGEDYFPSTKLSQHIIGMFYDEKCVVHTCCKQKFLFCLNDMVCMKM